MVENYTEQFEGQIINAIEDTEEARKDRPEFFIVNTADEGIMGRWCGCGMKGWLWWKRRKYSYRKIFKKYEEGELLVESHTICNHCNKLTSPSGYYFKEKPSLEDRVAILEEKLKLKSEKAKKRRHNKNK